MSKMPSRPISKPPWDGLRRRGPRSFVGQSHRSARCAPSPRNTALWSRSRPIPNIVRSSSPLSPNAWIVAWWCERWGAEAERSRRDQFAARPREAHRRLGRRSGGGAASAAHHAYDSAPAIAALERDDELFRATNLRAIHYTFLGNLFRMCGLALPSGTDGMGLPTGVQFLAPGGDDERLLSIGLGVERALAN